MQNASVQHIYSLFTKNPAVCTDTRNIIPGSMFFALKGENFNGNAYAQQALDGGCAYAIIDEEQYNKGDRFILVEMC